MATVLGRTRAVGLGKETTAGTTVAPTAWLPVTDLTVEDKMARLYDESGLGTRFKAFAADTDMITAEGNINGLVYDQSFGNIALATMGSVSTASHGSATGVKVHTFSVANTLPSFTIAMKDGNEDVRAGYGMLNQLELSVEQGQYFSYTSSWMARQTASSSNTVSYLTENRFRPKDVVIKVASTVAGLSGASALRVKSLTLTINNNLITEPNLGTTNPDYYPGVVETSISLGRVYLDTSLKSMVFGTTQQAMSITITNSDVSIGGGTPTNPSIVFTFQPGFFSEWSREGGLDDLKQETISYLPIYSTATSKQFDMVLTNTQTSY